MKIALTGGIACGKSALAKFLRELGIRLLDADDVVHELESAGGEAVTPIRLRFGDSVIASDGSVDRLSLATVVFSDDAARRDLEAILFPYVRARLRAFSLGLDESDGQPIDQRGEAKDQKMRISVIPLLFESHWEGDYDTIIAIASPKSLQIDRMMGTRGYTRAQAEARLAAQMPVSEKAERSNFVVVNDSTLENLKEEARRLVAWLKERAIHEH